MKTNNQNENRSEEAKLLIEKGLISETDNRSLIHVDSGNEQSAATHAQCLKDDYQGS